MFFVIGAWVSAVLDSQVVMTCRLRFFKKKSSAVVVTGGFDEFAGCGRAPEGIRRSLLPCRYWWSPWPTALFDSGGAFWERF